MAEVRAEPHPFRNATRILTSVLSPLEKRTLLFLAGRMPAWVNSDHLTSLGLAAMFGAGLSFWLAGTWPAAVVLVVICLAVNWFGDSLDGTLARVRKHERPRYGYYVDHIVDAFGALFLLGGLALSGYMSPLVAAGLLIAYLMMSIEVYLAAHTLGKFKITYFMLGPTELRILLSIGALWLLVRPDVTILNRTYNLFDVGGVAGIAGLMTILLLTGHADVVSGRTDPRSQCARTRECERPMTTAVRFARFNVVGVLGIGVQLLTVAALVYGLGIDAVVATAAGVSAAIVHNFAWHVRWTWQDRMRPGTSRVRAFIRFVGANGAVSLIGSVLLMPVLLGAGLPAIAANLGTIAICGVLNFGLAHAVFTRRTCHT